MAIRRRRGPPCQRPPSHWPSQLNQSAGQDANSGGQIGGGWVIEGLDGSLLAQSHFHEGCPSPCCRSL
ncbi:hypothetical protein QBC32DRAFT_352749 [Pseudoneurospora amorphoporcata]|uniref:Uncharacterized protein n=1 Tax=Pseudoneurospora amorphoporcata TaxID=241081 RepID=A0AAN6NN72_9PEZI|nr:hypothetical protein QBC32DRAFT_352749 [Pseudoneurospora amorphoporcata]